jgi:hypothetical protein
MEGLSSFAVYATAFASPAGSRLPNLLFELGGLGYLVALVGVVVALVPVALVIREERRRRMPASRRRRARRNMVPAAGGSAAGGSL